MSKAVPFFGGIPTTIEVRKFFETFGVPAVGTLLTHDAIAACIGVEPRSHRYRTVLGNVRRKLRREHNLDTGAEVGQGIKVLNSLERIEASEGDFRGGVRRVRKSHSRVRFTPDDGLTAEGKQRRDHLSLVTWRSLCALTSEVKALKPPPPPEALPRIAVGKAWHGSAWLG